MLAVPSALRRGVPVHRVEGVELDRLRLAVHAVLDVRAADRRRALRAQGERAAAAVLERVHLLLHDVRARPRGPLEERGVLEHGRQDRPVAVERAQALGLVDDVPPERLLGRHDVVRPARPLDPRTSLTPPAPRAARRGTGCGRARRRASSPARGRGRRPSPADSVSTSDADRREQRVPVGAGEVGSPDRAGEEHVAGEQAAVRVVGEVRGRVPGDGEHVEVDARDLERLPASSRTSGVCGRRGTRAG